jgi:hypothetical protein
MKSKCLNDKWYPAQLYAAANNDKAARSGAGFSFIWSFGIGHLFGIGILKFDITCDH